MNPILRLCMASIVLASACGVASAAEEEWAGVASEKATLDGKLYEMPVLRCAKMKYYMLSGAGIAPAAELKKHRCYVVTGTLSADEKTIVVKSMRLRDEFTGQLYFHKDSEKDKQYGLTVGGRGWYLRGKLPAPDEFKNGTKWTVKGTESDDTVFVDVVEMKKVE